MLSAVSQLPVLALPPIGGVLLILGAYILLVGPVNYLVLRRLDRREWAWITIPLLIAGFTVGAYGIGAAMRGSDVIVNEIAIVRGGQDTERGSALVYAGVFSPSEGSYQIVVPGGALVSAPINGEFMGGGRVAATAMDILQGDPARVRDLAIGYGGQRSMRIETTAPLPRLESALRLSGETLTGTLTNRSDRTLRGAVLVLGANVQSLGDLGPGATAKVDLRLDTQPWGMSLSDRVIGQAFVADAVEQQRWTVRRSMVDQLAYDPFSGYSGQLPADGPVLLSWDDRPIAGVSVEDRTPRLIDTVLYHQTLPLDATGHVAFKSDMVRGTTVQVDAPFFSKDPMTISFGQGSLTMAYRPIAFEGTIDPSRLLLSLGWGGEVVFNGSVVPVPIDPLAPPDQPMPEPVPCDPSAPDCVPGEGLPLVDVFDRTAEGGWVRLPRLAQGKLYEVNDPDRYVDPATGAVLVRFIADRPEGATFSVQVRIEGDVR
jgi:hypothetical protein